MYRLWRGWYNPSNRPRSLAMHLCRWKFLGLIQSGFPRLLESPGFFKIPGPGKSWKITLVLESPENWSLRSWKVLENCPWKLRINALRMNSVVNCDISGCTKFEIFRGLYPRPCWGSLQRSPRLPSCWGGANCPCQLPYLCSRPFAPWVSFLFVFKHSWAPKRSWKISHGGPGKSWIFCQ